MNRVFLSSILFFSFIFPSFFVQAQITQTPGIGIELSASTDNPLPGQRVTLTARSYTIDINASTIIWTVNDKVVQKDVGATTFEINAPALGKKSIVSVTAITTNNVKLTNSVTITSGSIDLIMENNGYIPPFFKGKLPTTYQNTTTIIAIPHLADSKGVEYDPKSLIYQWKKNSRVVEDQSGYGKQSFNLVGEIVPRAANISVTVSTRDGSTRATGYTSVSYNSPSLSFYVDDPLYGPLFNSAIKEKVLIGQEKETGVLAIPYGFNKPLSGIGNLALTWMINNIEHTELATNESITLRAPDNTSGSSNVELSLINNKEILQSASSGFKVYFSSDKTSDQDNNF